MVKLLALGGFLLDVVGAVGALALDSGPAGLVAWMAMNVSLVFLPLALRTVELLWTAIADAPEVLTWDADMRPRGVGPDSIRSG